MIILSNYRACISYPISTLDWRKIGLTYWRAYYDNMVSVSNTVKANPNYSTYFNNYTLPPAGPIGGFNTGALLVTGNKYGKIYIIGNNNSARVYDPATETYTPATNASVTGVVQTCNLLYDGTVCNIPAPTTLGTNFPITIYNPTTNAITTKNTFVFCNNVGIPDYWASIMLPSSVGTIPGSTPGTIFLPPYGTSYPSIYNPSADTITPITSVVYDSSNAGTTNQFYRDCSLLPSGNIFMVPYNATAAAIYNPITNASTFIQAPQSPPYAGLFANLWGSGRYYHSITLIDGRIFCPPYNRFQATALPGIIYNETTNTLTNTTPIEASIRKTILLPDGRVLCIPFTTRNRDALTPIRGAIYDPITDTVEYFDITGISSTAANPNNDYYRSAFMQFDGKVFCPIGSANSALRFGNINYTFDYNVLTSAYHNGR